MQIELLVGALNWQMGTSKWQLGKWEKSLGWKKFFGIKIFGEAGRKN